MKIAIVTADFNRKITSKMEEIASDYASDLGADIVKRIHVPGAFEIPFAVKKLLKKKEVDGVIALGAVIKGRTGHDRIVSENSSRKIMDLSLEYEKPVSLGIIGPDASKEETLQRYEAYAKRAAEAVIRLLRI